MPIRVSKPHPPPFGTLQVHWETYSFDHFKNLILNLRKLQFHDSNNWSQGSMSPQGKHWNDRDYGIAIFQCVYDVHRELAYHNSQSPHKRKSHLSMGMLERQPADMAMSAE